MDYLLHQLVRTAAANTPEATAIEDRNRSITYGELDSQSNRLANALISRGISRGDRVGFYLDKSIESVVALYGIMKAGAAYVPFDPKAPVARLGAIAANAGITCLVSGVEKAEQWAGLIAAGAALSTIVSLTPESDDVGSPDNVSLLTRNDVERFPASAPNVPQVHLDLAYILYTSGSTGEPKGVMLSHLNALTFVDWTVNEFDIGPDDRLSSHAPFHFDLSVFDLFAAARAGGTVVLVPPEASVFPIEIARFIASRAITVWYSVPSILSMMTIRGGLKGAEYPLLRTILFAGEVFPTKYLRRLMELLPHVRFCNLYGPTETNVCTWYDVPKLDSERTDPIPIGRAIPNVECYVVADDGALVSAGEVGELYVRGSTVMQGYWGDVERTARSLLPNSFAGPLHDRLYRTGDLVQEDEDGNFKFLGRRDAQVKSRGYRIELGDIEAALYAHPDIVECAVVAIPDELMTNRLRAYVVTRGDSDAATLTRHLAERLPGYMIPDSFAFMDTLPKTSTGKVERRALALVK